MVFRNHHLDEVVDAIYNCKALDLPYENGLCMHRDSSSTFFHGINLQSTYPAKDYYNFWHSQIRINIEFAFGMILQTMMMIL